MGISSGFRQTIGAKSVDASNIASGAATNGQILGADGSGGASWINNAGSALTTKGDLLGFDTAANRVPVGSDGQVLTGDSSQALGVAWNKAPVILADAAVSGSAAASLATGTIPARSVLRFHAMLKGAINSKGLQWTLNGDSGTNYQTVQSINGGAQTTTGGLAAMLITAAAVFNLNDIVHFVAQLENAATIEKTGDFRSWSVAPGASGAVRENRVGFCHWANSAAQVTSATLSVTDGTNALAIGSRLWVEGW